jgi:hypothetical protein
MGDQNREEERAKGYLIITTQLKQEFVVKISSVVHQAELPRQEATHP